MKKIIVVTENVEDVPLILFDEVELVIWRRNLSATAIRTAKNAVREFSPAELNSKKQAERSKEPFDGQRVLLNRMDAAGREILKPIWDDQHQVLQALRQTLKTQGDTFYLMLQKSFRKGERDNIFHKDYACGISSDRQRRQLERVLISVPHTGDSTECLASVDAGRPTPHLPTRRLSYYHPHHPDRVIRAGTADVTIIKSGRNGTVHRTPQTISEELRSWTSHDAGEIAEISRALGRQELRNLRARLGDYTPGS